MEKQEVDVVLFGISGDQDIKKTYPDLAKIEEFKDLDARKVRFCWLVGNKTSPIIKIERGERIKKALSIVWGDGYASNPTIKDIVSAQTADDLPDEILKGIYKMNTFSPSYRLKSKLISEYIFETLNSLIVLDSNTIAIMEIDERKKYAELVIKVSSELNGIVDRIENAYGVKAIDRKTKKEVKVRINDLME